ncbi:SCP2 sterol-binding domain-containing protein [Micromonospora echinofusca]|uniref:SCP2 sterol-binding domain-containing protein n=1 Tax=Micromonospora echinofusca TaxID=47858 RepID=UPI00341214D5
MTEAFFEQLASTEFEPRLCRMSGSVRFDIRDGDRVRKWLLTVDQGRLRLSQDGAPADAVFTMSSEVADAMARGELNGLAAILRGEIMVDGDFGLALRMGLLFPAPAVPREAGAPWTRGAAR